MDPLYMNQQMQNEFRPNGYESDDTSISNDDE